MNVSRMKKIITLLSSGEFISSEVISSRTGVNVRTISADLKELQDMIGKHGGRLERKPWYGSRLVVEDEEAFEAFCKRLFAAERADCFDSREDRMEYILRRFFYEKGYLRMEALCEEIGIGHTALSQDLKLMRALLGQYHLELETRPYYGMRIVGTEFHKRLCINGILIRQIDQKKPLLVSNVLDDGRKEAVGRISRVVEEVLHENSIEMPYVIMQNLTILLIAIFLFSKRDDYKAIAKLGVIPGICGINEPVVFGLPMVLNPVFAIPFICNSAVAAGIALVFTKIGFIACGVIDCPPGLPVFVTAGISYGWQGAVVQLVILAVTFLIWTPFVLISNKQPQAEE